MNLPTVAIRRLLPLAALVAAGCQSQPQKPLPTVGKVDLKRYSGTWYEVARVKNRFQRDDESAIAQYAPLTPDKVSVKNTALGPNGRVRAIEGTAEVVPGSEGSRLRVRFKGLAGLAPVPKEGNYWIIALDPQYRSAMVGTPDRDYLWILSRTPSLNARTLHKYTAQAEIFGFPIEKLIHDGPVQR